MRAHVASRNAWGDPKCNGLGDGECPAERRPSQLGYLQPSLSGPGARVAVVCNVTPAGGQSDETANTLKFAARAKLVQVGTHVPTTFWA